ncbi:uncharacterized protein BDCG_16799 [Blastomyces dermatitidis ER-3]|uniref:Uncharacterized protein n=1 Tax=Ajellomyces dermatitidis (strain ER-3 / ATCC MYA-2586) TaxID=559297 RepID=A0ABX2VUU5_AJEDR|nr:uncharacterized protein BDCG_16799 [Blastomyces dermatitidis ER-3]OAT00936.1 hypothetical protein BDCG_16799 [Blastomyces dermatitidis ER-3]
MISHSHNKHYHSAHTEQFISKSSYIDRFTFINDSELNVESLIENLKDIIMKKLSVPCVAESPAFFPASSAAASQSSTPVSVSGSPALTISVSAIPGFAVSAFIISSPFASVSEIILIEDDNTAKTISSHFQACLITSSLFSAEKAVYTLNSAEDRQSRMAEDLQSRMAEDLSVHGICGV